MFTLSIFFVLLAVLALVVSFLDLDRSIKKVARISSSVGLCLGVLCFIFSMMITVPAGHAGVGTLFGKVYKEFKDEGLSFVNPLSDWNYFDCRQKVINETSQVPSMDQLQTKIDASVKFRIIKGRTPSILQDTGNVEAAVKTHLVPKFRSLLREQGKSVERAEDFYKEQVQQRLQDILKTELAASLVSKGIEIQEVLLRNIDLPDEIDQGVKAKKKRDQEAEREKAELRRFETEQQKKVKSAEAEKQAAEMEAQKVKVLADAKAYEIKKVNDAIARNPAYIQLEALKALEEISKDPNAKLYFLNGDSPQPLPLMHLGK